MDAIPTLENQAQVPTFRRSVTRKMVGFKERLAERIVEARELKGWDQRELAYRSKLTEKTIGRLEKGQVDKPRPSTMRQLAEALEVEIADLRPDMETEEKNLRAQLDRIEKLVADNAETIDAMAMQLALAVAALEPEQQSGEQSRRGRTSGKKRAAG